MNYYTISGDVASKWVTAQSVLNEEEIRFHTCSLCGFNELVNWDELTPVFECESVTKNRKLPDVILYGGKHLHAYNRWRIVSEKFKNFFEENEFKGAYFTPVKLVYKDRNSYFTIEENYYLWQITGKGKIDYNKLGIKICNCDECHMYIFEGKFPINITWDKGIYPTLLKEETWDGSDVFGEEICTSLFAKRILEAGITGIQFCDLKLKYAALNSRKRIIKASQIEL